MNEQVVKDWTAALRSGEYEQTDAYLRDSVGYCCLGVLCDLAVKANVIPAPTEQEDGVFIYDGNTRTLPDEVKEWVGLKHDDGSFTPPDDSIPDSLAQMNDASETFKNIADMIESTPEGLFA